MPEATSDKAAIRCAIYTRKSSEEGLEQDFNSLDAQREACEAYIRSQKHEGWIALPEMYDDGGISGATMERPALKRLLADIDKRRIDTVVVYKVDRLTRSLHDFARIVDVFDRHGVSFVSVTQAFNTTSSMGRLTLNMLLSFAQFEREVTGERIRDKIAASKKKGMWMGGNPPLGYDVKDKKLVVNREEAETVRQMYRRYLALGSVADLKYALDRDGIVSKVRVDRYNRRTGGKPFARGALYLMLQNRSYRGEIVHRDQGYPGRHRAIIDEKLWDAVQRQLAENRVERATGERAAHPSLLAGLVYDAAGDRMTPSHANKNGKRYRYYVSRSLIGAGRRGTKRGSRVPAADLEGVVEDRLRQSLTSEAEVFGGIEPLAASTADYQSLVVKAAELAARWPMLAAADKRALLATLVERIDLMADRLDISILLSRLVATLRGETCEDDWIPPSESGGSAVTITMPVRLRRAGMETRLLIDCRGNDVRRKPDHSILRLLAQANRYREMVMNNGGKTMAELATEAGVGGSYFTRVLRLSFLSPAVVKAMLSNRHPLELTAKRLAKETRLPIAWHEQLGALLGTD